MIEWLSVKRLRAHVRALELHAWFHAQCADDPRTTVPAAAEELDENGLGVLDAWCGLVDGMPFVIRARPLDHLPGHGVEVRLPAHADAQSVRAVIDLVRRHLPSLRDEYFDPCARGHGCASE